MQLVKNTLLIFLLLLPFTSSANHIFGGELSYRYISGNTYKIVLSLYGDCSAPQNLFTGLLKGKPSIFFVDNSDTLAKIKLAFDTTSGVEITPVCPAFKDSTKCSNLLNSIRGIKRFDYTSTYTLPYASANWKVIYDGSLDSTSAGRITGLINVASVGIIYMIAELNNIASPNSICPFRTLKLNSPVDVDIGSVSE